MATAFAVFCATDGSLIFYNRDTVPTAGDEFEGKVASNVYTGFESVIYNDGSDIPWYNEKASILSVSFTPEFATVKPISTSLWFNYVEKMTSFDGTNLDTSNVTDMRYMFCYCKSLTSLDLSNFDTSKVTNMNQIFRGCKKLTSLNLSSFNTSNVTDMGQMFYDCKALTYLDLSSFDTSNVTGMHYMFNNCSSLTSLDLSNFDTSNVTDMRYMFYGCSNLTTIYASELWVVIKVTSSFSSSMFYGCINLIGDMQYDSAKTNITYATYNEGYLTYKIYFLYPENRFVITGSDLNRVAEALRAKTGTVAGLSFPDGFIAAIESIKVATEVEATDDGNGNVVVSMDGSSTDDGTGNVSIS